MRIKYWGEGMYRQRKKDRRSFCGKVLFPLIAKGDYMVEKDRRCIPDRRLGNIHLELADGIDHRLPEYLTNTSLYPSGKNDS